MSATDDEEMEIPGREVAYRLFAAEYDDAEVSYAESDEERAPNYVIAPTGARINRLFAVGTLTEITQVNEEMVRARVVDPTGAFVVYAGQYQPDALATLESLEPPAFVAVTGKARTFEPEDGDQIYTSIRPESIATVDADTRDRWVISAAEQTVERIGMYAAAADAEGRGDELADALLEAGVEPGLAAGIPLAQDSYGTTPSYLAALRDCALEAVEVVAGKRDQVRPFDAVPNGTAPEYADVTFDSLAEYVDIDLALESIATGAGSADASDGAESEGEPIAATPGGSDAGDADVDSTSSATGTATATSRESATDLESDSVAESAADAESDTGADADTDADADSGIDTSDLESEAEAPASGLEDDADAAGEPGADTEAEAAADTDALESESTATFDEGDVATDAADDTAGDADADDDDALGDFDDGDSGMYEMDDDEREQLEEQFGAEFTTGSEVEEPGEAGIDVEVAETDEAEADADGVTDTAETAETDDTEIADTETADDDGLGTPPESGLEGDDDANDEATDDDDTADESADLEDVDLQDYVIETMAELDDGDGADRPELVATVAADTGASEDAVEDAIQDALMGGQCYEPNDDSLKPI